MAHSNTPSTNAPSTKSPSTSAPSTNGPSADARDPQPTYHHNADLLRGYRESRDLRLRNHLVEGNLPLVRRVAARQSQHTSLPFEDLMQLGCLGLIRAIEAFDPSRHNALSSYAVPYIQGAMQHHLRDQHPPLRCSRQLRELHRRGQLLQQQRLHRQLPPLAEASLAEALGCRPERWREACDLHHALQLRSLDAPALTGEDTALLLVDLLAAPDRPHPCRPDHPAESPCCEPDRQRRLRQRLSSLEPGLLLLLEGRVLAGASWRQLGERLGLRARVAQRCFDALMVQLRQDLRDDGPDHGPDDGPDDGDDAPGVGRRSRRPNEAVPPGPGPAPARSPEERRSGSGGR